LPVTLSNTGAATLTGIAPTVTGTNSSDFTITSAGTCNATLSAGSSCTIYISFTPASAASFTATLSVADNATGSPQSVPLTGAGTAALVAQAVLSPTSLAFPSTTVGVAATSLPIMLSNPGNSALTISSISITSAGGFGQTNTCGTSLATGGSCIITVSFTPATSGALGATLSVTDNATGSPQTLAITGSGAVAATPQATLSPTSLAFPSTTVGVTATSLPIMLSNPGNAALAISSISVAGASGFGQTNTCGTSLGAGGSCIITVSFTPAAAGALTASISVVDNAAGSPQTAALTGTGASIVTGGTFTVGTSTPTATVQPGGVAQFNLVIAPLGGSYNNLVTLSATGLPPGALVSFLPAAVTPGSTGAPSVMSIQTSTGLAHNELPTQHGSHLPMLAMLAGLPLLGFAGSLRRLRKGKGRWMLLCLAALAILPVLALSGCGGGYFGPAPKTYAVTVIGTSGSLQESTTISVTVQ
jgi:hypothetical protein